MIKNLGKIDRLLRLILGVVIITYGIMIGSLIAIIGGIILIVTSVFSFCPLYCSLKLNTCSRDNSKTEKD